MKYPIGIQSFEQIINEGFVYVDKTALIHHLVTNGQIYFLSRPRRFGKSLLISTLKNYFLGRKELFNNLAISSLEKDWLTYPVFHIDFNGSNFTTSDGLSDILDGYLRQWEQQYGQSPYSQALGSRFIYVLQQAHLQTGQRAVILIDEYDKPILDVLDSGITATFDNRNQLLEEKNREILKTFYSVFKAANEHIKFVLLTGVTKFSQVSIFSGFNQPADITLDARYEAICGITQQEVELYFSASIHEMAQKFHLQDEEIKVLLKEQYDGYHFSENLTDIYNPFSLLNTLATQRIDDYWFRTGTPSYLIRLLNHSKENLNELTGRFYDTSEFIDYKADVEKPLPMFYQSGYLTIKSYNFEQNTFLLDFPNNEVKKGFITALANNYLKPSQEAGSWTRDAVTALKEGDTEQFRILLTSFLADIPYSMRRKEDERERERYFHYTFYLLMRMISLYTIYTEKQQSKGRVDCIIETPHFIYIFEFKLDGKAEEALNQIERQGYAKPYDADKRQLFKIGVSFSSESGTIEDWQII